MIQRMPKPVALMARRLEADAEMPVITVAHVGLSKAASVAEALRIGNALFKGTRNARADSITSVDWMDSTLVVRTRDIEMHVKPMLISTSHLTLVHAKSDARWITPIHVDAHTESALTAFRGIATTAEQNRVAAALLRVAGRSAFAAALSAENPGRTRRAHASERADGIMHQRALAHFESMHPEHEGDCSLTLSTWHDVPSFEIYVQKTNEVFTAAAPPPQGSSGPYRRLMVQADGAPASAYFSTPDATVSIGHGDMSPVERARAMRDPLLRHLVWSRM